MTDQQRAQVWQRRDKLLAQLNFLTDEGEAEAIKAQIDACNQELTINTNNLPKEISESESLQLILYGSVITVTAPISDSFSPKKQESPPTVPAGIAIKTFNQSMENPEKLKRMIQLRQLNTPY